MPEEAKKPDHPCICMTRAGKQFFQYARYFDGRNWSKGFWFTSDCKARYGELTRMLLGREQEERPVTSWRELV